MKTVSFNVSQSFELDPWWKSSPSDVVEQALKFVPELVRASSMAPDVLRRMKDMELQLVASKETASHAANAACEQVTKACATTLQEREKMCTMLQSENESLKNMLQHMQKESQLRDERHAEELHETRKFVQSGSQLISAQQMGSVAEQDVECIIADCILCEIENVSRIEGRGDRHITTPNGFQCLQETKAVERLHSKNDIDKFKRDVHDGIVNHRINAALLISLKSQTIPNHGPGPCCIWFENGPQGRVPVIMLASNHKISIQIAVQTLVWLQEMAQKEYQARGSSTSAESDAMEREQALLKEQLPKLIESVQQMEVDLEARIDMLKTLMEAAERERSQQSDVRFLVLKLQQQIPWLTSNQDSCKHLAERILQEFHEQKGKYPVTSQLTLSQRNAIKNAGGMKTVLEALKKRKRDEKAIESDSLVDSVQCED